MQRETTADVAIIGADLAGLVAGAILTRHGRRVVVVEYADTVGGRSGAVETPDGYWIDFGHRDAHGVGDCQFPWHHGVEAAREADVEIVSHPITRVLRVHRLPDGPVFDGGDWSAGGFLAAARDLFECPADGLDELGAVLARLAAAKPDEVEAALPVGLGAWAEANVRHPGVRHAHRTRSAAPGQGRGRGRQADTRVADPVLVRVFLARIRDRRAVVLVVGHVVVVLIDDPGGVRRDDREVVEGGVAALEEIEEDRDVAVRRAGDGERNDTVVPMERPLIGRGLARDGLRVENGLVERERSPRAIERSEIRITGAATPKGPPHPATSIEERSSPTFTKARPCASNVSASLSSCAVESMPREYAPPFPSGSL